MTTKKLNTTKTAIAKAIKFTVNETLAIETAKAVIGVGTMTASIDEYCQKIHKNLKGNKLGTIKNGDAVMIRFGETLMTEKPSLAESSYKNMLTAFRQACNEGKPFSLNAYRKSAKKGAKTEKSDEVQAIVKMTIVKDSTAEQVANGLRQVFEAKRETYAELVSFLIDALDEYEGK
jgi:hypothetical protein